MAATCGKMYTFVRYDGNAAVLRVDASNALLRFVSEDAAAAPWAGHASAGAAVALEVARYDNGLKAVVCRRGEPAAKRART
jgi:hypothetical protein